MLVKGLSNAMYDILCVAIILYYCGSLEWPLSFNLGLVNFNNFLVFLEAKHKTRSPSNV